MTEAHPSGRDFEPELAALRARGAQRFDPIGLHFIATLARRAAHQQGDVRRMLDAKLAAALAACGERVNSAAMAADTVVCPVPDAHPGGRQPRPLADLVQRHLQRRAAQADEGAPGELPALQFFRDTWARLRVRRQLNLSLAKVPENAGPLHSDRLVLRALQTMQALSPAYLNRYMAYVDALLWLDAAQGGRVAAPSHVARGDSDRKRKPGRARPKRA